MKKIFAVIAIMAMCMAVMGVANANPGDKGGNKNKWTCTLDTPVVKQDNPKLQVIVPEGETCVISDSNIKTIRNAKGTKNVYVYNTTVANGIHLIGVTNDVVIGVKGCKFDPNVRNNIHVHKSHNVKICWMSANNIDVAQNDGIITVADSHADHNIMVSNNYAFNNDGDDNTGHANNGAIRILRNSAGNHITARNNDGRDLIARKNTPKVRS